MTRRKSVLLVAGMAVAGMAVVGGSDAWAQSCFDRCVLKPLQRRVWYGSRTVKSVDTQCHVTAQVLDSQEWVCPDGCVIEPSATTYPVTVITPSGDAGCEAYAPRYTAWCRDGLPGIPRGTTTPTQLSAATLSSTTVRLSWLDNSSACVCEQGCSEPVAAAWHSFVVERRSRTGSFSTLAMVGPNPEFVDQVAAGGMGQVYRVRGYDEYGGSPYTNDAAVDAGADACCSASSPCCVSAQAVQGNGGPYVSLTWGDQASGEAGYRVQRRESWGGWTTIADLAANSTSFDDFSVAPRTGYVYRIVTYAPGGSAASEEVFVSTP